jgi:glycosyltransferase involved in cell wall biosynthesis
LIIDGGSTDNSVAIIQRYTDRLAYWVSEPDRGQSQAINKGLSRAKGEILGWLNSDDVLLPGAVSLAVAALTQDEDVDVVYGHVERIDAEGRRVPTPILPKDRVEFGSHTALGESVVNSAGCFWRRRIMEKAGIIDESLHYAMDYEYWIRMLIEGGRFKRLEETLAEFRLSSGSKTVGQTAKMAQEALGVIDRYLARVDVAHKLVLSTRQLRRQANRGRGNMALHVVYGCVRDRKWGEALRWFARAHRYDPLVLFNRKWLDLALARLARRHTTAAGDVLTKKQN